MRILNDAAVARQVALEEEMHESGIARYRERLLKARTYQDESSTRPAVQLLDACIGKLAAAFKGWYEEAASGKTGPRATAYLLLKDMEPETVAFITVKKALDRVTRPAPLTNVAEVVAKAIEDELSFRAFNSQIPKLWKAVTGSLKVEQVGPTEKHNRLRRLVRRYDIDFEPWSNKQQLLVGIKCLDLLIEVTGMFEVRNFNTTGTAKQKLFQATPETVEWIKAANSACEVLSPIYLPMIVPPVEWTTPFDGGYLGNAFRRLPMVKSRNKNYLSELANHEMPMVYEAINAVQSTAWAINKNVLETVQAIRRADTGLGGFPSEAEMELPKFPEDFTDKEAIQVWKREAASIHVSNGKRRSRLIMAAKAVWVAEKFKDEEAIYFPHYCDFRGRIYPRPLFLTPQGADWCKGLLQFGEGKALGHRGAAWLAVHGSNLWGFDKVPLQDRIKWTEEHTREILECATDPLGFTFWADADKPFQFLAFCYEWAGYHREGASFVSHLPVALDGSCNGLQNFSMALRDAVGGAAVNLIPQETPADIYQRVADVVKTKVEILCTSEELAVAAMAQKWSASGMIGRKLCKGPVMTLPYGAKEYGMRDSVAQFINEQQEGNLKPLFDRLEVFPAATFITRLIWTSIGEVVVAAREAMTFLQKVAQVASREGLPITWVAPSGFPVFQEYKTMLGSVVTTQLGGQRLELTLSRYGDTLDKKRQGAGVSPNFVHSLDSAHLMRTVVTCKANDVHSFAMIHDSYGTHACDTDVLGAALRQSFVEQYQGNVLEEFRKTIADQLLPENLADLPATPTMGSLDLNAVLDSDFFFA